MSERVSEGVGLRCIDWDRCVVCLFVWIFCRLCYSCGQSVTHKRRRGQVDGDGEEGSLSSCIVNKTENIHG